MAEKKQIEAGLTDIKVDPKELLAHGKIKKVTRVRVLRDNVGSFNKGDITDDPAVVALMSHPTKRKLVEAVD